jgi:hypothetical protein
MLPCVLVLVHSAFHLETEELVLAALTFYLISLVHFAIGKILSLDYRHDFLANIPNWHYAVRDPSIYREEIDDLSTSYAARSFRTNGSLFGSKMDPLCVVKVSHDGASIMSAEVRNTFEQPGLLVPAEGHKDPNAYFLT